MAKREYTIVRKDRAGYDATKVPTAIDVAWAAGIYEGEGSCGKAGHNGKSFNVCVPQKYPELLYRLKDLFGGRVTLYENGVGKGGKFQVYHWSICGDRARVFLGCIYPFLTARRKAQIESTSANDFLEYVEDLLHPVFGSDLYKIHESLWERVRQNIEIQRKKAKEHRKKMLAAYELSRANDQEYKEKKRDAQRRRRKLAKEQKLHLVEVQNSA
jgi:hypothetical protein